MINKVFNILFCFLFVLSFSNCSELVKIEKNEKLETTCLLDNGFCPEESISTCSNNAVNSPDCNICEIGYSYNETTSECLIKACDNGAINPLLCNVCSSGWEFDDIGKICIFKNFSQSYTTAPSYDKTTKLSFKVIENFDSESFTLVRVLKDGAVAQVSQNLSFTELGGAVVWTATPSEVGIWNLVFTTPSMPTEIVIEVKVSQPEICSGTSSVCVFLKEKWNMGQAAGNTGDWYHNSDKFHTNISISLFPQLDLMITDAYSAQYGVTYGRVIVGNSSTAVTSGEEWRSQMRGPMLNYSYANINTVYKQYINNNVYWYPEHNDHDGKDHYNAKIPFINSSQGSSGSEMDEIKNFIYTLAAFKPGVKKILKEKGLLMPTLQMIFRRARVESDAVYLTGKAHPSAFDNYDSIMEMVKMANEIEINNIPPMVQIKTQSETFTTVNGKLEKWFDTPVSIARIFRGNEFTKTITVDARDSYDVNARELTFHWVVLRGNPSGVRIAAKNSNFSVAEISIDYHPETNIEGETRLTNMIEVGVFVHNGAYYSAPAFVTSFTLNNEERTYSAGVLQNITYNENYVHPRLK